MTPERVNEIYDVLATLHIELHHDPSSLGPLYLQDLIAKTRGYLNQVSLILQEVSRESLALTRQLDAHETAFQASSDQLLVEDIEVRNLPSIEDRKAKINLTLQSDLKAINSIKKALKEIGFVEKAVRHKYKDLESAISSVRMQKSLIDVEQNTGAFHGDDTNTSRGQHKLGKRKPASPVSDPFEDLDVMKFLDDAMASEGGSKKGEIDDVSDLTSVLDEVVSEPLSEEEKQMKAFLDGDEYADVFDGLVKGQ